MAVALKQTQTPQYKNYQLQILTNARVLANELLSFGYTLSSGKNPRIYFRPVKNRNYSFLTEKELKLLL